MRTRILIGLAGFAILNVLAFQNCGRSFKTTDLGATDLASSTSLSKEVDELMMCPIYNQPICATNETIQLIKDEKGCEHPACVKNPTPICPQYVPPICAENEVVAIVVDEKGCSHPRCEPKEPAVLCPQIAAPVCKEGTKAVFGKDSKGCDTVACEANPNPMCPQYMPPLCRDN